MTRHLLIVATAFRLTGIVLGAASIAALVDVADSWFLMQRTPPPDLGPPLDLTTYGLVGLLANAARGIGGGLYALAGLLTVILLVIAVVAVLGLCMRCYCISPAAVSERMPAGRGSSGVLIASSLALASCAIMAAMRRDHALFAVLPIGPQLCCSGC